MLLLFFYSFAYGFAWGYALNKIYINSYKFRECPDQTLFVGDSQHWNSGFDITNRAGIANTEIMYNLNCN